MDEETKERILRQLTLKPRELIHGEDIKNNSGLYGDGRGVRGEGTGNWGDVSNVKGDITGVGPGDLSRFVGCTTDIKTSVSEIIAILEDVGKVIKHYAV